MTILMSFQTVFSVFSLRYQTNYSWCGYKNIVPCFSTLMVLVLVGNAEHVAQTLRKVLHFEEKKPICDFF